MKKGVCIGVLVLLIGCFQVLLAHPSWGIVVDDNGCIYFADVMHNGDGTLWRIDPESHELEAVFKNFHAHQIYMDDSQNIFAGVAIWRTGEIEGEGHNYLFKYETQSKTLDTLLFTDDWDEYHGQNFALSKDGEGVYFTMNKQIHIKPFNGKSRPLVNHTFGHIDTMITDYNGTLWITDSEANNGTLYRWSTSEGLVAYAQDLMPQDPEDPLFEERRHQTFYGIGFSHRELPLLTENANRSINEITEDRKSKVVYRSEPYWSPTGIYFKNGYYYIIETGYHRQHLGPRIVVTDKDFNILKLYTIDFSSNSLK